jgi:hypothetical protein
MKDEGGRMKGEAAGERGQASPHVGVDFILHPSAFSL